MLLDDALIILKNGKEDTAYSFRGKSYTYAELYRNVCNIYHFLLLNNPFKKPVVVYGNKEIYMKSSFLACSYAGIAYVPIDESIPDDRARTIVNQVNPYCLIGDFHCDGIKTISSKDISEIMGYDLFDEIQDIYLQPDDLYYIIFTSGSTGVPKGVKVSYRNLDSCIKWLQIITDMKKGVVLNQAVFSFDLSVADLYLSLISGSEHFALENNKLDFMNIFRDLKKSHASIAVMTPSFADLLLLDKSFNRELLPNLKTILFCGERLLKSTVQKLFDRFEDLKIINSYGPTECTFAVTGMEVTGTMADIPVGCPKKDVDIFILDKDTRELQEEEIGEILISGESVAAGYLGAEKETAFTEYKGKRAYHTGDLGYLKDGILFFVGRMDQQIKFKGYRIELGDIENNFYELGYIEKAVVIAEQTADHKITKLVAFIKLKATGKSVNEIKRDLSLRIPKYMIPNIRIIEEFPVNQNGKVDITKLRGMI